MLKVTLARIRNSFKFTLLLQVLLIGSAPQADATEGLTRKAQALFESITGVTLPVSDPRMGQMKKLMAKGKYYEAATIAANDDAAINVRVREIFSAMSTRDESPLAPLNDFVYTGMYIAAGKFEDGDARKMLYGDIVAIGQSGLSNVDEPNPRNNGHYEDLARPRFGHNLKQVMDGVPQSVLRTDIPANATAGLLSTRGWASAHVIMGTNRRPIEYTFRSFLCRPLSAMRDNTVPADRVARDVPRDPGGDPEEFRINCSSCHNGMDALRGAFAQYEYTDQLLFGPVDRNNGRFNSVTRVAHKLNRNSDSFPTGYVQRDDSWVNYFTGAQNASIGWDGFTQGNGLKEFGYMVAHSRGFSECMAKRFYSLICMKRHFHVQKMLEGDYAQLEAAQPRISHLADKFEQNGHKILELMKHTGISCMND